jgi:hypothetical protein
MMTLKECFIKECQDKAYFSNGQVVAPKIISVAVKLPSGAIEIITNYEDTVGKALYYRDKYDDEFRLTANPQVQIVNFMVV